jgi:hypothetical protein
MSLKDFTTEALVEELLRREGVEKFVCNDPDSNYTVGTWNKHDGSGHVRTTLDAAGPARILVVID